MSSITDQNYTKNHNTCMFDNFFPKTMPFNMEKFGRAGQATDDNIIWRVCFAYLMTKATGIHPEYVILLAFTR
jgi:hypothetical protein